ncbi:MAG: hypothetical protein GF364_08390 [Candidatus Lokiarchaeota archaeon]|nr:hypothetical protein [Candidatus Lokiarchaeota archaeon]
MPLPSRYELESKLFGIIKTMAKLYENVASGRFSLKNYRDYIQKKINDLFLIELAFRKKDVNIQSVLEDMNLEQEFNKILDKIKSCSLYEGFNINTQEKQANISNSTISKSVMSTIVSENQAENLSDIKIEEISDLEQDIVEINKLKISSIELARISSLITSDFITILDYFELKIENKTLLFELIENLTDNLMQFPGMQELAVDISTAIQNLQKNNLDKDKNLKKQFESYYYKFKKSIFTKEEKDNFKSE